MSKLARHDDAIRKERGATLIGGVDEAGRGALAGPVVAAVVVLAPGARLKGVNDSKALAPEEREALAPMIVEQAAAFALGIASAAEVDRINVLQATLRAARRALDRLSQAPDHLVTDFLKIDPAPCQVTAIAHGDSTSLAVAAASVLAKVARDRIMRLLDAEYPAYGFARHKGYGTPEHWDALNRVGPSTLHRLSFKGVCWFDAEPGVKSASFAGGALPARRPEADLGAFLRDALRGAATSAHPFLPEREYEPARDLSS